MFKLHVQVQTSFFYRENDIQIAKYWPRTGRKSAELRRSLSARRDTTLFRLHATSPIIYCTIW